MKRLVLLTMCSFLLSSVPGFAQLFNFGNKSHTFTFEKLPTTVDELKALPEAELTDCYATVALTLAVLCNYEADVNETIAMLDVLRGPDPTSAYGKQFLRDRLSGKYYKPRSFFKGATPDNNYTPSQPFTITVSSNKYSFDNENWATLYVTSGGADSPRPVKLRKKPSTGQWFLNDIQCLSDIRVPAEDDPWR
jgi:hypothetical protein